MHKTADFHLNLLVSWELLTEGYLGRPHAFDAFQADRKTFTRLGNSLVGLSLERPYLVIILNLSLQIFEMHRFTTEMHEIQFEM